jgi:hypothetical protein
MHHRYPSCIEWEQDTPISDNPMNGRVFIQGRAGPPWDTWIRDFLYRSDIPFEWIELRDDKAAREMAVSDGRRLEAAWPAGC